MIAGVCAHKTLAMLLSMSSDVLSFFAMWLHMQGIHRVCTWMLEADVGV